MKQADSQSRLEQIRRPWERCLQDETGRTTDRNKHSENQFKQLKEYGGEFKYIENKANEGGWRDNY